MQPAKPVYRAGQVLEDRIYNDYAECDYVAAVAAQQLEEKGVDVGLEKDPAAERTIYTAQYRGSVVRFSCDGGRYRSEIVGGR